MQVNDQKCHLKWVYSTFIQLCGLKSNNWGYKTSSVNHCQANHLKFWKPNNCGWVVLCGESLNVARWNTQQMLLIRVFILVWIFTTPRHFVINEENIFISVLFFEISCIETDRFTSRCIAEYVAFISSLVVVFALSILRRVFTLFWFGSGRCTRSWKLIKPPYPGLFNFRPQEGGGGAYFTS